MLCIESVSLCKIHCLQAILLAKLDFHWFCSGSSFVGWSGKGAESFAGAWHSIWLLLVLFWTSVFDFWSLPQYINLPSVTLPFDATSKMIRKHEDKFSFSKFNSAGGLRFCKISPPPLSQLSNFQKAKRTDNHLKRSVHGTQAHKVFTVVFPLGVSACLELSLFWDVVPRVSSPGLSAPA